MEGGYCSFSTRENISKMILGEDLCKKYVLMPLLELVQNELKDRRGSEERCMATILQESILHQMHDVHAIHPKLRGIKHLFRDKKGFLHKVDLLEKSIFISQLQNSKNEEFWLRLSNSNMIVIGIKWNNEIYQYQIKVKSPYHYKGKSYETVEDAISYLQTQNPGCTRSTVSQSTDGINIDVQFIET